MIVVGVRHVFGGPVAGLLDRADTVIHADIRGQLDVSGVGGEVDRRLHTRQGVELLLDPRGAGGAGHPIQIQIH